MKTYFYFSSKYIVLLKDNAYDFFNAFFDYELGESLRVGLYLKKRNPITNKIEEKNFHIISPTQIELLNNLKSDLTEILVSDWENILKYGVRNPHDQFQPNTLSISQNDEITYEVTNPLRSIEDRYIKDNIRLYFFEGSDLLDIYITFFRKALGGENEMC